MIFFVYYNGLENIDSFMEVISSNYPHKKITPDSLLIHTTDINETNITIYEKLEKVATTGQLLIITFNAYYGRLSQDIWDWIKLKEPNTQLM